MAVRAYPKDQLRTRIPQLTISAILYSSVDQMRDSQSSCATCAKAKIKCVRFPQQDACDRCTRLQKQCHARETPARKDRISKPSYVVLIYV